MDKDRFRTAAGDRERILSAAADILACSRQIAEKKAAILKDENQIESPCPVDPAGRSHEFRGNKGYGHDAGHHAAGTTLEDVYRILAEQLPETDALDVEIVSSGTDGVYLAVFCMRQDAGAVEEALRQGGFARPAQTVDEDPGREDRGAESRYRETDPGN